MTKFSRVTLQPAYVIHSRAYRDTSLIVTAMSPEHGRVALVARGAKSARSRNYALLQPFQPLLLSWSGQGELMNLTAVEPQGTAMALRGRALVCGLYLNEVIVRCVHEAEGQIELFSQYDSALRLLCGAATDLQLQGVLRVFEIQLLDNLGYGLSLTYDVSGATVATDACYDYQMDRGPVPHAEPEIAGVRVSGRTLQVLAQGSLLEEVDPVVFKEAKTLLRYALSRLLGDKPLMSRELLRSSL
ncbi:MAG: DNA repair protein RecO [Gammaproteobacteria bacterium]|nr:DNA repair protein RecO [Gammaproteobacteria bacterium]MDH5801038.1 DNA repair protein RecO [Gammaproteobacteria bacterium]